MKILITGISGFMGRAYEKYFLQNGMDVYGITRGKSASPSHISIPLYDPRILKTVFDKHTFDYVVHCAGIIRTPFVSDFYSANTVSTLALLEAMKLAKTTHTPTLLMGTAAEYGDIFNDSSIERFKEEDRCLPVSHYGKSKLIATHEAMEYAKNGGNVRVLRVFNLLGREQPNGFCVPDLLSRLKQNGVETLRQDPSMRNIRDFIDMRDLMEWGWEVLQTERSNGQIINVCTGNGVPIAEVLDYLSQKLQGPRVSAFSNASPSSISIGDPSKLFKMIGQKTPRSLRESLDWILESYDTKNTHDHLPSL